MRKKKFTAIIPMVDIDKSLFGTQIYEVSQGVIQKQALTWRISHHQQRQPALSILHPPSFCYLKYRRSVERGAFLHCVMWSLWSRLEKLYSTTVIVSTSCNGTLFSGMYFEIIYQNIESVQIETRRRVFCYLFCSDGDTIARLFLFDRITTVALVYYSKCRQKEASS